MGAAPPAHPGSPMREGSCHLQYADDQRQIRKSLINVFEYTVSSHKLEILPGRGGWWQQHVFIRVVANEQPSSCWRWWWGPLCSGLGAARTCLVQGMGLTSNHSGQH